MEIEIEFISSKILDPLKEREKIKYLMDRIRKGKILVTEGSLSSEEEARLIEETMKRINNNFSGIEVSTLIEREVEKRGGFRERLIKILGGKTGGLTVIGPSKLIKKVKKKPQKILVSAEKSKEGVKEKKKK